MKAIELMIGDWVYINGIPRQITHISKKKIGYHIQPQECRVYYTRLCEVQPIPIDEFDVTSYFYEHYRLEWNDDNEEFKEYIIYFKENTFYIRYVHQLQNILNLYK